MPSGPDADEVPTPERDAVPTVVCALSIGEIEISNIKKENLKRSRFLFIHKGFHERYTITAIYPSFS
jgi:hypothetical protein